MMGLTIIGIQCDGPLELALGAGFIQIRVEKSKS